MLAKTRVEGLECFNLHADACSFTADVDTEVAVRCVHHNKHPGSALHRELPKQSWNLANSASAAEHLRPNYDVLRARVAATTVKCGPSRVAAALCLRCVYVRSSCFPWPPRLRLG